MVRFKETEATKLRTLAEYRRLILLGKASLPLDAARRIVGPDCAYHLYFRHADHTTESGEDDPKRSRLSRRRHK